MSRRPANRYVHNYVPTESDLARFTGRVATHVINIADEERECDCCGIARLQPGEDTCGLCRDRINNPRRPS